MGAWLRRFLGEGSRPQRFYFIAHNRNHVRLFADAAAILSDEGHRCGFVTLEEVHLGEGASAEIAARRLASATWTAAEPSFAPGDVLVVGNDWAPKPLRALLDRRRERAIFAVGYIDGCRITDPVKYRRVDHVLGWGPSSLDLFPVPVTVVGHPLIEPWARAPPHFAEPPFAIVNYKFTYGWKAGREEWMSAVLGACRQAEIGVRISRHPSDPDDPLRLPNDPMHDLLREGSVLVTRPSTTIYEAMAAGKPVVFFAHDEDLGEFAEPMGAFEAAPTPANELPRLIRQALDGRLTYRTRSRAFLERHVSIDPRQPAPLRIARALADFAAKT